MKTISKLRYIHVFIYHLVNKYAGRFEVFFSRNRDHLLNYPPIFIIGAPRSGSTLLYQVMTEYYDFGYLSNLHCTFYGSPSLVERLVHPQKWRKPSDYTSLHGQTQGQAAPSECGAFWYRFFRRKPQYVPLSEVDPKKMRQLRGAVRALGNAFGKPILFKNLMCSLRLEPLASVLPEALFIVIRRHEIDNAHSLLEGRKKVYGDYSKWWSAEPPAINRLKGLPPHEQVIEQIFQIYDLIERNCQVIGPLRFLEVQYEAFCDDVFGTLQKISQFLASHHLFPNTYPDNVPSHFERRTEIRIDLGLYQKVVVYAHSKKQWNKMNQRGNLRRLSE